MARPRKVHPPDPLSDLSRKSEILEREMATQRTAIEKLKEIGVRRPHALPANPAMPAKRRAVR